ncbi:rRNA maturation RNase YbeY [Candidatus Gottesmanbacteria bacterium RIFCSPHIGHO2_02_FULL_39_14]|uniref:rRNA maturation RNase YbeY n=2 Tax=Candidatus Gottesmaniibacteriota TaxID=1752720 RepID=A0A1F5ZVK9_9BACT|nr:MAG: rRNA maturation RNase YbeY [Candidatus Gottesmanbacteria bacterium RBG_16_38_7b]OGG16384.1 MAG: rRNA maturation RNase YbeY [Candidatus Gottesmanbacteria bacterium RIFCSPHIGHO2_02_FULL_39_14]
MVKVFIKTDSHYKVNRKRIRQRIEEYLAKKKVRGKTEVSLAVVGDRQMKFLNQKFRQLNQTTDVLAFPLLNMEERAKFIDPPDNILRLGDIVISYPQVIEEASNEETFIDDKIDELILHGLDHLLGINLD